MTRERRPVDQEGSADSLPEEGTKRPVREA